MGRIAAEQTSRATRRETGARACASETERLAGQIMRLLAANEEARGLVGRMDHVTLLPNRVSFLAEFPDLRVAGKSQSLVLVTLAEARHFNDLLRALGHAYADDFVRAGAKRIAELLPKDTPVYHVSVLSFAFLADDGADGRPPLVVDEIVHAFRNSIVCQDIPVDTKVGIGVTPLSRYAREPGELLRSTLAAAQDSRRNHEGWAWYNPRTDEAHVRAFRILTDMPAAFGAPDQLALQFQPRVAMSGGRCLGAEALIRWTHPELGSISPGEFVPLAEATALITPLTRWVIESALVSARAWQKDWPGMRVSINVSPRNIEEPDFVPLLCDIANRIGVDPEVVELEFTEGVLATNWQLMLEQMERLRDNGFHIAIDDFGSGYSNMSYLGKIPAKYLKIDQAFVRTLDDDATKQVLVRAIIELGHALDFTVVAEGIETRNSFERLAAWGCDEGQGYHMSRPLDETRFREWLAATG